MRMLIAFMAASLGAGAIVGLATVFLIVTPPVARADEPVCQTMAEVEEQVEAAGGKIVGAATYRGMQTDSLIVVQGEQSIMFFGFKNGCLFGYQNIEPAAKEKAA